MLLNAKDRKSTSQTADQYKQIYREYKNESQSLPFTDQSNSMKHYPSRVQEVPPKSTKDENSFYDPPYSHSFADEKRPVDRNESPVFKSKYARESNLDGSQYMKDLQRILNQPSRILDKKKEVELRDGP